MKIVPRFVFSALLALVGVAPAAAQDRRPGDPPSTRGKGDGTRDFFERFFDPRLSTEQRRELVQLEALRRQQERYDLSLRMLSSMQARHHETMELIIRNMAPSGRYEYNPATGRYDRYVPSPRR